MSNLIYNNLQISQAVSSPPFEGGSGGMAQARAKRVAPNLREAD
ncbi:hypothetical protein [robinz microvirus RP_81]|nr:hypothetical protein [robinz microvirus RP_81]